jgi:predicted outer membrane protein
MKRWSIGLVGTVCALLAGSACASEEPAPAASKPLVPGAPNAVAPVARPGMFAAASAPFVRRLTPEQREEWRFLKDAAAAGRFENDAARLALAKSNDANVRSLAVTLVNHHAASLATLQRMLQVRSMAAPMLSNDQRKALNRLARTQGVKFDREWMEAVALHSQQDSVQAFEKAAATARDPHLRAWIERELPTLRWQVQAAERVVNGGTKFARLAPSLPQSAIKSPAPPAMAPGDASRYMGAAPAAFGGATGDLGEGNMLLGPARPVAVKLTEPNTR